MVYPATWSSVSQIRWEDMQLWRQPFAAPTGQWQTMTVGWDQATAQLQDLSPGIGYDVQIRAVDSSGNAGAWSATTTFVATQDNIPPSTPDAPQVAASRIAVQVTHDLGRSSGGTFNLESDLDHLEIHAAYEPTFTPSAATLLGKLKANGGMIQAQIPAVGTYNVESTDAIYVRVIAVDIAGNRSGPSTAASATALLIDDAHISDLTVSKVTAGTITASWVLAGEIKTADVGARFRASSTGIELYNSAGTRTFFGEAATGNVTLTGEINSGVSGNRIIINPGAAGLPTIRFYANTGSNFAFINGSSGGSDVNIGINSAQYTNGSDTLTDRLFITAGSGTYLHVIDAVTQGTKGGQVGITANSVDIEYAYGSTVGGHLTASNVQAAMSFEGTANGGQYLAYDGVAYSGLHVNAANSSEQSVYIDSLGIQFTGKIRAQGGAFDAVVASTAIFNGGVADMQVLFGVTMTTTPVVVASVQCTATPSAVYMSARSTSGFTMTRASTTNAANVHYWSFRTS
jgi:hypothetical protein